MFGLFVFFGRAKKIFGGAFKFLFSVKNICHEGFQKKGFYLDVMLCHAGVAACKLSGDFVHRVKIVGGTYSFFYDGETDCGERVIRNGAGSIVQCGLDRAAEAPRGYAGVSVSFAGDASDLEEWLELLRADKIFCETIGDGIVCVYGYSPLLKGGIQVDGRKINVQIALNQGTVHIGSPLLLGSY